MIDIVGRKLFGGDYILIKIRWAKVTSYYIGVIREVVTLIDAKGFTKEELFFNAYDPELAMCQKDIRWPNPNHYMQILKIKKPNKTIVNILGDYHV
jgi:hypothetical protein